MLKLVVLIALVSLNQQVKSPWIPAGIYGAIVLFLSLIFGVPFLATLISAAISTLLAFGYFWLLKRIQDNNVAYWLTAIVGMFIFLLV